MCKFLGKKISGIKLFVNQKLVNILTFYWLSLLTHKPIRLIVKPPAQ